MIKEHFEGITLEQQRQFEMLAPLYEDWNSKINVISRKDIENLYLHHVLHSLAIAKYITFKPGTKIMDMGCGGGFPGIPLAIMFPDVEFHLVPHCLYSFCATVTSKEWFFIRVPLTA